ncbi:MAG: hypothetical protein K6E34_02990 [Lachnospiraceae bacterium]|nr:hypothetical protein [Lachnospiraceae bacterium]
MIQVTLAVCLIFFNFIIYFLFGSVLCAGKNRKMSLTRTVFAGLFFYYLLFSVCCIGVMLRWRPLHVLSSIWLFVMLAMSVIGAVKARHMAADALGRAVSFIERNAFFFILITLVTIVFASVVVASYQFTLDASYYVGNATTAIQTDTVNMYDPFTGEWLDHYEMRYFFASFSINDAVMSSFFHIHPLIWCKTTMAGTAIILTVMVLYMIGRKLFGTDMKKITVFIILAAVADFFMITIYSTAAFLTTRTYEGKCLLANVVLPGILYIYICLLEDEKDRRTWLLLLLVALGASALSSSSNMLVPAMIAVTVMPLALLRRDIWVIPKALVCMLPGLILTVIYIAYVKNMIVFYTYPPGY